LGEQDERWGHVVGTHPEQQAEGQTEILSFEGFYRSQHDRTYRALGLALRSTTLAREATDEAMTRALERWDKIGHYDRPEQWVFRVGLNWAISRLRRRRYETLSVLVEPSTEDGLPDPAVATALATLPVKLRAVVVARLYLDWSTEATSQALRIPVGTVKSRLSRALTRLAKELE
jgi:RNA polymerase sigma-70 factor, ECF subfamily